MRGFVEDPVAQTAIGLVKGQRQADYGDPIDNLTDIASGWSAILGVDVSPRQVSLAMIWLKICRDKNGSAGRDNEVDICGYALLLQYERESRTYAADEEADSRSNSESPEGQEEERPKVPMGLPNAIPSVPHE